MTPMAHESQGEGRAHQRVMQCPVCACTDVSAVLEIRRPAHWRDALSGGLSPTPTRPEDVRRWQTGSKQSFESVLSDHLVFLDGGLRQIMAGLPPNRVAR